MPHRMSGGFTKRATVDLKRQLDARILRRFRLVVRNLLMQLRIDECGLAIEVELGVERGIMNFRISSVPLVAAAMLFCSAATSFGAPLNYNESVSGDINGSQLMSLDVGTNTVTGALHSVFSQGTLSSDLDNFPIQVPVGSVLQSVSLTFAVTQQLPDTYSIFVQYMLQGAFPFPTLDITPEIQLLSATSPIELFDAALPLAGGLFSEGLYYVTTNKQGVGGPGPTATYGGNWTFTFTFEVTEVTQVPEPGTVGLFATGLALFAAASRRRRRAHV